MAERKLPLSTAALAATGTTVCNRNWPNAIFMPSEYAWD